VEPLDEDEEEAGAATNGFAEAEAEDGDVAEARKALGATDEYCCAYADDAPNGFGSDA